MGTSKKVGIWIRVSTEDQAKGESPEIHEKRARMYAEAKGWEIVTVYHLEGVSGKSVIGHSEAKRMMWDIKSGKISGLIFSKLARLARSTKELLDFSDFFREHDADLISLEESIDTSSAAGRLFYTLIAAMAQWEREEITARIKASIPVRAKMGKTLGGEAPFGYRYENKELVVNEEEAPIRRKIFELFKEHKRKKTVARMLNECGHRTRRGNNFSAQTITKMLRDPVSKGKRRMNYTRSHKSSDGAGYRKSEEEWVFVEVPAIVSTKLWDECNSILDEQFTGNRVFKKGKHLFVNYAKCGCGGKMYVPSNSPKYVCYDCRRKITKDDLEEIFKIELQSFLNSKERIAEYLNGIFDEIKYKAAEIESLKAQKLKLDNKVESLLNLHMEGQIPTHKFKSFFDPVNERIEQITQQIPILENEINLIGEQQVSAEKIFEIARSTHNNWENMEYVEKRKIVESVVDSVIIGEEEIEFNLNYVPYGHQAANAALLKDGVRGNNLQG